MSERNQASSPQSTLPQSTNTAAAGPKKTWLYVLGGTALLLFGAGVVIQVLRPPSAFPEDGRPKQAPPGRTSTDGTAQKKRILAMVDKTPISHEDVADVCVTRIGAEVLENLINRTIIQQACDARGLEITEAEVDAEITKISKKFNMAVDQWLKMLQAERNVTEAQYRHDIIWPMIALRKLAGEEIKVTKSEIKKAFERHYGEKVKVKAIFLDNLRRASDVWEKAQANPERFDNLVRQHSIDPQSRPLDGLIQPIGRHSGNETLEKAAFDLQEGEISPVIQIGVDQQCAILKCEGRIAPAVTEMTDDIKEILYEQIHEEKVQTSAAEVFKKLREEASVDNYLTNISTGGERRPAAGRGEKNPSSIRQTGANGPGKAQGKRSSAGK